MLERAIKRSLERYTVEKSGIFLAERLLAERPGAGAALLLARCFVQVGKHGRALRVLEPYWRRDWECRYLYCVCCMELGEYALVYAALRPLMQCWRPEERWEVPAVGSLAAEDMGDAAEVASLPWLAEGLYWLGRVYRLSTRDHAAAARCFRKALSIDPYMWGCIEALCELDACPNLSAALSGERNGSDSNEGAAEENRRQPVRNVDPVEKPPATDSVEEANAGADRASAMPPARMPTEMVRAWAHSWQQLPPQSTLELLVRLGSARALLSAYRPEDALRLLATVPARHYDTGWVLAQVGRAHFENGDQAECARVFEHLLQRDSSGQTDGLEFYSTALWHLRRETELSAVAQQALQVDRFSAAAWCAAGNAFSLHRDPDTAIAFFLRAAQTDPECAYACTLAGHEYMYKDDFESAILCYQDALARNPRHYNAWFGMGQIYQRQEQYRTAERHYRLALRIHPHSSMLWYHLAHVIRLGGGRHREALQALERALAENPKNPVAQFELGKLHFEMGRLADAWHTLCRLRDQVPREAAVLYQMGLVAKQLGRADAADLFSAALDLDPKQSLYRHALFSSEPAESAAENG
ncbi:hypothetical protein CDCA_CDCA04G1259 [Cyanidium caldarium]|uniref:Uncharacterized protein n=1 Tax=Cyanidium caldarium TaxID=2771 RepID=A0AAV9ISV1_CYACA|nr:hypothetical protein CDCA_CDCA04G1259 [Cyanidium caldarium]